MENLYIKDRIEHLIYCWTDFTYISLFCELQLIQSPALAPLGLVMLKTTSEELACPREDLSVARKDELRKLLLEQVPTVLGLLTGKSYLILCAKGFQMYHF